MKNIILLGATGSIGNSVLSVIKQNKNELNLYGIAFSASIKKAESIINEFNPKYVYTDSSESHSYLKHTFENDTELNI
jgi:1-deoxy-D-xylulose-5-phosphate reductoisomerase